mgnify:CR=1 FL=1
MHLCLATKRSSRSRWRRSSILFLSYINYSRFSLSRFFLFAFTSIHCLLENSIRFLGVVEKLLLVLIIIRIRLSFPAFSSQLSSSRSFVFSRAVSPFFIPFFSFLFFFFGNSTTDRSVRPRPEMRELIPRPATTLKNVYRQRPWKRKAGKKIAESLNRHTETF